MSQAQSPEVINKIAQLRAKALQNTLTIEEMREAIQMLREGRKAASQEARASKVAPRSADSLLGELGV